MVTKRIRSEYMKKFKDPKWETYSKCYEEMLRYRLTRRLLEHSHNPWFWSGSDTDSDSSGVSPVAHTKGQNQGEVQADPGPGHRTEGELEECAGSRTDRPPQGSTMIIPRLPVSEEKEEEKGCHRDEAEAIAAVEEEREERRVDSRGSRRRQEITGETDQEGESGAARLQQVKPSKSSKPAWRSSRVRPAPPPALTEDGKEKRHPFVLYGSGERDADVAGRRTHNVGPVASTKEIHASALRAKTRREVERQIHNEKAERRRAKSADAGKKQVTAAPPEFNPWLTEYMRCFSARTR